MSKEYDNYIHEHVGNVMKGYKWICAHISNMPELQDYLTPELQNQLEHHDESKWYPNEYYAYDKYFYGGNRSFKVVEDFNYAWLHHIHDNPHHWQHWVLLEDDPSNGSPYKVMEMPVNYVIEMICDWWAFSWAKGNLMEIFDWYDKHKETMLLHPKTKKLVEKILAKIATFLQGRSKEDGE